MSELHIACLPALADGGLARGALLIDTLFAGPYWQAETSRTRDEMWQPCAVR